MAAAFRVALEGLYPGAGVSRVVRDLARPVFEVGWICGVRTGHTGPALADVPLPPYVLGTALSSLASAVGGEAPGPELLQLVSYHGSVEGAHGRYWVTRIHREADAHGQELVTYRLSTYTQGRLRDALHGVHAESVTALPQHFQDAADGPFLARL
ncbi:hypothetical protein [Streptomyces albiflavescens]|nr:hypothetical protein [Streptomyces albiflavescens]